jgi:hypothetical protein
MNGMNRKMNGTVLMSRNKDSLGIIMSVKQWGEGEKYISYCAFPQ